MAGQPTSYTGYWAAATLAAFAYQPIIGSSLITGSSNPLDLEKFQRIIDLKSAEFNEAAVKQNYLTPIPSTATQAYAAAQRIVRDGALADAFRLIYTGPDPKYAQRYEDSFQNALKMLAAGDRLLPDAASNTTTALPVWSGIASAQITPSLGAVADLVIPTDF